MGSKHNTITAPLLAALFITATLAAGCSTVKDTYRTLDGFAQGGYGGCLTTMMVTMLFLGVYRLELPGRLSSLLSWLSGGVFEGFLLSRLLDVWVYDLVKPWHDPSTYWKIFLCVTVPIFVGCACAGRIVHSIAIWLTNQLFPKNA